MKAPTKNMAQTDHSALATPTPAKSLVPAWPDIRVSTKLVEANNSCATKTGNVSCTNAFNSIRKG